MDPTEAVQKLVDPRLGDNCPLDSVAKVKSFNESGMELILYFHSSRGTPNPFDLFADGSARESVHT